MAIQKLCPKCPDSEVVTELFQRSKVEIVHIVCASCDNIDEKDQDPRTETIAEYVRFESVQKLEQEDALDLFDFYEELLKEEGG